MDWIRRNWPDLLIGLALLLVIGGIIATLLNGGNFLPFGRSGTPSTVNQSAPPSEVDSTPVSPTDPTGTVGGGNTSNDVTSNDVATSGGVTPVPLDPTAANDIVTNDTVTNDTVTMPANQGGDGTITPVSPSLTDDGAAPTTDTAATETEPVTESLTPSGEATAPYRISVGAFGSTENAERRAQSFRDAGYPVFVGNQGDLALVLVGPYNSQAEAEQVKAKLQASGLEANPIIYEFSPTDSTVAGDTSATASAPETTAESAADTTVTTSEAPATSALPTSSSGRYLQVGAYGSLEAAAPQRSKLEGLGFTVSSVEEGSYVKLLVGPYDESNLGSAQSRLSAQGIDNFVR
jgi:cell division septation protein DedD